MNIEEAYMSERKRAGIARAKERARILEDAGWQPVSKEEQRKRMEPYRVIGAWGTEDED